MRHAPSVLPALGGAALTLAAAIVAIPLAALAAAWYLVRLPFRVAWAWIRRAALAVRTRVWAYRLSRRPLRFRHDIRDAARAARTIRLPPDSLRDADAVLAAVQAAPAPLVHIALNEFALPGGRDPFAVVPPAVRDDLARAMLAEALMRVEPPRVGRATRTAETEVSVEGLGLTASARSR